MTAGAVTYDKRLRDLEAEAFRTGRALAGHREQLAAIRTRQHTAPGDTGSPGNPVGEPEQRTIEQRLDTVAQRLDTIADVLSALTRALGIDPASAG